MEAAMIQCFATPSCVSSFTGSVQPRLLSASKIDSHTTIHPRVLHKHDAFFEALYVRSGTGCYIIEEVRYPIKAGDLILCNSGILHDEDPSSSEDLNMLSVAITDVQVEDLPPNHLLGGQYAPVFPAGEYSEIVSFLMMTIYSLLANDPAGASETCHHLTMSLMSCLLMLIRGRYESSGDTLLSQNNIISAQVKNFINAHYDEDFTLQDIAAAIHVTPYHLSHVFKEQTGYSPKQYTLRRRLGEAQTLLITTKMSITDIAAAVGYGNPSHFDSMFSKYIGMSPSCYREFYVSREGADTEKKELL